jgi:signal transduction histidine kinase
MEAAEAERRRWARELHDETLQGLGALKVLLAATSRAEGLPDATRAALERAIEQVGGEIENLRAIITDLRPSALDELGLVPALTSLVQRTAARAGLEMRTELPDEVPGGRLPAPVETTVYRIAQEALTNVAKHARATSATMRLSFENGSVELVVTDDGQGFDPDAPTQGFGLIGMRERVELAGGTLRLERRPDGTVLRARVPLRD